MNDALKITKVSALAICSLILGILSLMCLGMFSGIPAIICGHLAHSHIKRSDGALHGGGLAIGGLVTGYIGTVLTTLAVLGILAGMLLPAVATARDRAQRVRCMNNLAQIGRCCMEYAADNDERLPQSFKALESYAGNSPALFVCPATGKQPGDFSSVDEWTDYVLVAEISPNDASNAILAFSKPECYRGKGGNVLTRDGAVRWCDSGEYGALTGGAIHER